jgi:hypothetical protein
MAGGSRTWLRPIAVTGAAGALALGVSAAHARGRDAPPVVTAPSSGVSTSSTGARTLEIDLHDSTGTVWARALIDEGNRRGGDTGLGADWPDLTLLIRPGGCDGASAGRGVDPFGNGELDIPFDRLLADQFAVVGLRDGRILCGEHAGRARFAENQNLTVRPSWPAPRRRRDRITVCLADYLTRDPAPPACVVSIVRAKSGLSTIYVPGGFEGSQSAPVQLRAGRCSQFAAGPVIPLESSPGDHDLATRSRTDLPIPFATLARGSWVIETGRADPPHDILACGEF